MVARHLIMTIADEMGLGVTSLAGGPVYEGWNPGPVPLKRLPAVESPSNNDLTVSLSTRRLAFVFC